MFGFVSGQEGNSKIKKTNFFASMTTPSNKDASHPSLDYMAPYDFSRLPVCLKHQSNGPPTPVDPCIYEIGRKIPSAKRTTTRYDQPKPFNLAVGQPPFPIIYIGGPQGEAIKKKEEKENEEWTKIYLEHFSKGG